MKSRTNQHKWGFRAAAVAIAILPFITLEIGLRIFGGSNDQAKLSQGLQPEVPLFTWDETIQEFRISLPYQQFFAEVSFPPKAPARSNPKHSQTATLVDTKRKTCDKLIFVLGGSTVQGRPFAPQTAFSAWAEDDLSHAVPSERIRIVNCGGVSFASHRLSRLVPELLTYDPDLIVIATGHNEFLEDHTYSRSTSTSVGSGIANSLNQLKTVALLRHWISPNTMINAAAEVPVPNHEFKAKLDHAAGYETYHYDAEWHANVVKQFAESVTRMIDQCESAKVPVCLIELAANHRDTAPLKSEHAPSVSQAQQIQWRASMDLAEQAIESMDWVAAISFLQDCVKHSPEHALSHFRLARCLKANQQDQDASRHFQFAVDHDVCPLRMKTKLVAKLLNIAEHRSVPLIRCGPLLDTLREGTGTEFGFDLFLDHVHPTIRSHQVIGKQLAQTIQEMGLVISQDQQRFSHSPSLLKRRIDEQSATYFTNGRRRIGWLESWARAEKTSAEILPISAEDLTQRIRRQLELRDTSIAFQLMAVLMKTPDGSLRLLQLAEDFLQSGQQQPAAIVVQAIGIQAIDIQAIDIQAINIQQLSENDFTEGHAIQFAALKDQLRLNLAPDANALLPSRQDQLADVILTSDQRLLVHDILVHN